MDELFRDLENAVIMRREFHCYKQQVNGNTRWVIEFSDPQEANIFESKLNRFLNRFRRSERSV
jgi:hypothetical protein